MKSQVKSIVLLPYKLKFYHQNLQTHIKYYFHSHTKVNNNTNVEDHHNLYFNDLIFNCIIYTNANDFRYTSDINIVDNQH
jgi:hypothetical protein